MIYTISKEEAFRCILHVRASYKIILGYYMIVVGRTVPIPCIMHLNMPDRHNIHVMCCVILLIYINIISNLGHAGLISRSCTVLMEHAVTFLHPLVFINYI